MKTRLMQVLALVALVSACGGGATPPPALGGTSGEQVRSLPTPMVYKDLVNHATCWETWTGSIFCIMDKE